MSLSWLASLLIGLAAAAASWGLLTSDGSWLDDLERKWADQLRRLRYSTLQLRVYLLCWLGITSAVGLLLWVGFGSPLFAVCAIGREQVAEALRERKISVTHKRPKKKT